MSITQRLMKTGDFNLNFAPDCPRSVLATIDFFDHVVVTPSRLLPITDFSDASILSSSLFTGVITKKPDAYTLQGSDLYYWLGTPDGLGDLLDTRLALLPATLSTWVGFIKPASLAAGTVNNTGTTVGNLGPFQWVTRREALDSVCKSMGAEYRVNPNFTLDAATAANLFVSASPTVVITRKDEGQDGVFRGLVSDDLHYSSDVEQYTTYVIACGQGNGSLMKTGAAGIGTPIYKDGLNNNVLMERLVDAPTEPSYNANTVALNTLALYSSKRTTTTLSSTTYNVTRFAKAGDTVYVYDQAADILDTANQINYRGEPITPKKLRVYGLTYPIEAGMGVYIRRSGATPTYTDVTDYVVWETGQPVSWEVGSPTLAIDNNTATTGAAGYLGANGAVSARGAGEGALTQYTPVITQAATPTQTVQSGAYTRKGRWVSGYFDVTIGTPTTGTAGSSIQVTLPTPALGTPAGVFDDFGILGQFRLRDSSSSAVYSTGRVVLNSATTALFNVTANGGLLDVYLGASSFTAALAVGDRISGTFAYEADDD